MVLSIGGSILFRGRVLWLWLCVGLIVFLLGSVVVSMEPWHLIIAEDDGNCKMDAFIIADYPALLWRRSLRLVARSSRIL